MTEETTTTEAADVANSGSSHCSLPVMVTLRFKREDRRGFQLFKKVCQFSRVPSIGETIWFWHNDDFQVGSVGHHVPEDLPCVLCTDDREFSEYVKHTIDSIKEAGFQ